jgi:hypothetical protein
MHRSTKITLTIAAIALPLIAQQQPKVPNFQAPPGHTVKVESVTTRYNFSGFNREVTIPLAPFVWPDAKIPKEYKRTQTVKPATKAATSLWNDWAAVLPAFGAPKTKSAQAFTGGDGGTIMYFQWDRPLPPDARKAICRVLYGRDERDFTKDTKDDILVTDTWVILWSFSKPLSKIKEAHQKHTFETMSAEAQKWMDANPEKAKKFQQAPKK